jgi:uncharacterized protein (TIGR02217 family)
MFIESPRFPDYISYGSSGGPSFLTVITEAAESGVESRNIVRDYAEGRWDASFGVMNAADIDAVVAFFRLTKGRAHSFRYKDWADFTCTSSNGFVGDYGIADGVSVLYTLNKQYIVGDAASYRRILKPVPGSVLVQVDGLGETGVTVSYSAGTVTFDVAPADGAVLTWSGEFDVPARFDVDQLSAAIDDYGVASIGQLPIKELLKL